MAQHCGIKLNLNEYVKKCPDCDYESSPNEVESSDNEDGFSDCEDEVDLLKLFFGYCFWCLSDN